MSSETVNGTSMATFIKWELAQSSKIIKAKSQREEARMYTCDNSTQWYAKTSESEEREYRRRKRRRLIIIGVSTFLLIIIVIGAIVGVVINNRDTESDDSRPSSTATASSIKAACSVTQYPDSCYSSISSAQEADGSNVDPEALFKLSLKVATDAISNITSLPDALSSLTDDKGLQGVLANCKEMFYDAIDRINESVELLTPKPGEELLTTSKISTLRSWLSAAITDQATCLDELDNTTSSIRGAMAAALVNSTQFTSNSLAIATKILSHLQELDIPFHRKLLDAGSGLPHWVAGSQRRMLLQGSRLLTPNVTVAKDGTGQFQTINGALAVVPKKSEFPFVIHIKAGVYDEIVKVDKNMWNVVMYGDGMYKTIVSGRLNRVDGITSTSATATFTAVGKNFMARDMGFENVSGPEKQQAVALRSASDFSLFYRCSFVGFQDTLYAHSLRQFYRDCDIVGTVDFIFGDASAVLQNCKILPRQPLANQKDTITAQGRTDPNENTGISIQGCTIAAYDTVTVLTYLGRPWKDYSTTVIMQSDIGALIDGEGWLEWEPGVVPPSTIFYAEFGNDGAGAGVAKRVDWPGYHPTISRNEAGNFGVNSFILGSEWLPATGVEFAGSV